MHENEAQIDSGMQPGDEKNIQQWQIIFVGFVCAIQKQNIVMVLQDINWLWVDKEKMSQVFLFISLDMPYHTLPLLTGLQGIQQGLNWTLSSKLLTGNPNSQIIKIL